VKPKHRNKLSERKKAADGRLRFSLKFRDRDEAGSSTGLLALQSRCSQAMERRLDRSPLSATARPEAIAADFLLGNRRETKLAGVAGPDVSPVFVARQQ
jgi:hypothetical protein